MQTLRNESETYLHRTCAVSYLRPDIVLVSFREAISPLRLSSISSGCLQEPRQRVLRESRTQERYEVPLLSELARCHRSASLPARLILRSPLPTKRSRSFALHWERGPSGPLNITFAATNEAKRTLRAPGAHEKRALEDLTLPGPFSLPFITAAARLRSSGDNNLVLLILHLFTDKVTEGNSWCLFLAHVLVVGILTSTLLD
jgi:hypothetical protein